MAASLRDVSLQDRIMDRVVTVEDCWEWTGARNNKGYGVIRINGVLKRAPRVSYEAFVGSIPEGLQIDHLCRNHGCVKPSHLEPVTNRENALRGINKNSAAHLSGHCLKGHDISGDGAYIRPSNGRRECRECRRIDRTLASRRRREAQKHR